MKTQAICSGTRSFRQTWEEEFNNHAKASSKVICLSRHQTSQKFKKIFHRFIAANCPSGVLWSNGKYKKKNGFTENLLAFLLKIISRLHAMENLNQSDQDWIVACEFLTNLIIIMPWCQASRCENLHCGIIS